MAFDLMQNKIDSSITQLQHAWSILSAWRSGRDNFVTFSEIDLVEEHIFPIVARLSDSWCMQSPGTAVLCSAVDEHVSERTYVQALPYSFMSLKQAQSSLHHILDEINVTTLGNRLEEVKLTQASKGPTLSLLAQWRQRYRQFVDSLDSQDFRP